MTMEGFRTAGMVLSGINSALLVVLLSVWLRNYRKFGSTMVLGLVGFSAVLLLENLIAGVVITFSRQFRVGDTVLLEKDYGTVEDITITHTIIKLWDWKRLIIPNNQMLNREMVSYTTKDSYLWAYVEFWVSYDADILKVEEVALEAAQKSLHFAREGVPRFWIMEMAREGIKCWVAAWTKSPTDSWYIKIDIRTRLIQDFQKRGIKTHSYNIGGEDLRFSGEVAREDVDNTFRKKDDGGDSTNAGNQV